MERKEQLRERSSGCTAASLQTPANAAGEAPVSGPRSRRLETRMARIDMDTRMPGRCSPVCFGTAGIRRSAARLLTSSPP